MKQFSKSVQSIYSVFNWEKKNAEHAKNASVKKKARYFGTQVLPYRQS